MLRKFQLSDKLLFYVTLGGTFIALFIIALQSEGTYDGGDGVQHYLISRYAFSHSELLFDLWGKPLFTLIAWPFAQFGLKGMYFLNILLGIFSSVFAFRVAQKLNLKQSWILPVLICFSPVFFGVMNSGLTEPMFACALIFAVSLAMNERYAWAAVVVSFLMFIRPEANFVLPVFAVFFLLKKKYLPVLLLPTGFILYSIAGYFQFHDILWVLNRTPYNETTATTYGDVKGELFHYFINYHDIVGLPIAILFIAGIIYSALRLFPAVRQKLNPAEGRNKLIDEYVLVYGCLFSIVIAHSIIWGMGLFPTLGLYRYMSTAAPLIALFCLGGLNVLIYSFHRSWLLQFTVTIILAAWIIVQPFRQSYYPFALNAQEEVIAEATDWLNANFEYETIYYLHPFVVTRFDADPFDQSKVNQLWAIDPAQPGLYLPTGSIIIWDSHFGPADGKLPLENLVNCTDLQMLGSFKPETDFTIYGGQPFEVCIFRKK